MIFYWKIVAQAKLLIGEGHWVQAGSCCITRVMIFYAVLVMQLIWVDRRRPTWPQSSDNVHHFFFYPNNYKDINNTWNYFPYEMRCPINLKCDWHACVTGSGSYAHDDACGSRVPRLLWPTLPPAWQVIWIQGQYLEYLTVDYSEHQFMYKCQIQRKQKNP